MKKIFYILIIILFLNSCLVERTKIIKGVKSEGPVKINTPDQTITTRGAGKVLANSIDSMTEGVPGVLNAAQVVLSILPLFLDNKSKKKIYTTTKKFVPNGLNNANAKKINDYKATKKFVPTNVKTSNPQIVDDNKYKSYVKMSEW